MREQQRNIDSRPSFNITSQPANLNAPATPVDQLVDPGQSIRLQQFAHGLGQLVPMLQNYNQGRIDESIKAETALGQYDAAIGSPNAGSENNHRVAAFGKARALSSGIEYAHELTNEVADKYSVDDPKSWDSHGNPVDAVSAHFQDKARQAVQGMPPEYATLFLHSVEGARLAAVAEKQKQVSDKVHTDKVQSVSTIMADELGTYSQSGQVTPEGSRERYSKMLEYATGQLGLDRKTASAALAEQYAQTAIANKQPELLDFLHVKDANGIALGQTEAGKALLKARATAQKEKDGELDLGFINDLAAHKVKVDNGEFGLADAKNLITKYPGKLSGDDKQIAGMLASSIHNKAELAKKGAMDEALSPEYYMKVSLAENELKQAIARGDGSADQLLPLLQQQFPDTFKGRKLGKAMADSQIANTENAALQSTARTAHLTQLPDGADKDKLVETRMAQFERDGQKNGMPTEAVLGSQLYWLSANGAESKKFNSILNNGLKTAPLDINAPPTPEFLDAVNLYKQAYKVNPVMAEKMLDNGNRDLLHQYLSAESQTGSNPAKAWAAVQQNLAKPIHERDVVYKTASQDDIEAGLDTIEGLDDTKNKQEIILRHAAYTKDAIQNKMSPADASMAAAARINKEFVSLLGTRSYAGDLTIPPDAEDFLRHYITKTYGKPGGKPRSSVGRFFLGEDMGGYEVHVDPTHSGAMNVYKDGQPIPASSFMFNKEYADYHKSQQITGQEATRRYFLAVEAAERNKQEELKKIQFDHLGNPYTP